MLGGTETIESHMHEGQSLVSHLNAEIAAAGAFMPDITACLVWLKSSFLFVRMQTTKNPSDYKLRPGLDAAGLDSHLKAMLARNLRRLSEHGMIRFADDGMGVQPLLLGQVMARFCIEFDTVCSFSTVDCTAGLEAIVTLLAKATEFSTPLYLRVTEKKTLFGINESKAIRFPILDGKKKSKIKTAAMKVKRRCLPPPQANSHVSLPDARGVCCRRHCSSSCALAAMASASSTRPTSRSPRAEDASSTRSSTT